MTTISPFLAEIEQQYHKLLPFLPGQGQLNLRHMRATHFDQITKLGPVQPNQATWKHALLKPLFDTAFHSVLHPNDKIALPVLAPFLADLKSNVQIYINGHYNHALSNRIEADAHITLNHFSRLGKTQPEILHELIEKSLASKNIFHQINGVLATDGALIVIPPNIQLSSPIYIYHFLINFSDNASMVHPQTHIFLGKNAKATIVEKQVLLNQCKVLFNAQTFIQCDSDSDLDYHHLTMGSKDAYCFNHLVTKQSKSSRLNIVTLSSGSIYHRIEQTSHLKEDHAEFSSHGLMLAAPFQHCDWVNHLEHEASFTNSKQLINAVIAKDGHSSFLGKITVTQQAAKTTAKMENFNLMLAQSGKADTAPQLEILTDDVQCTHGAAVGKLDENALYYLCSRGLSEIDAKSMLINGFIQTIIHRIFNEKIRADFNHYIQSQLYELTKVDIHHEINSG